VARLSRLVADLPAGPGSRRPCDALPLIAE